MKKVIKGLNVFVFLAATLAIAGVFYEGMAQEWFSAVGILIVLMDYSFLLSSVLNIIFYRENRVITGFTIFSLVMLVIALVMKFAGMTYPIISLLLWYFYIWFYYGAMVVREHYKKQENRE